ncbi:cysteine desulfurase NifS [bacterium]|nr:cysteine desulfurase NifS [bacterium]
MKPLIYADNNATTRVAPEVVHEMLPFCTEQYGNPSSMYAFAQAPAKAMDTARERVAALVGAERPDEIIFTSCGTESDNAAVFGTLAALPDKKHVVLSSVEHPAVYNLAETLQHRGCRTTMLRVDSQGIVDLDQLANSIWDDTALVSVMWANNETGVVSPVKEIAAICRAKGVAFHTDAVQAVGKLPVNVREAGAQLLSLSGHKIHAPKGVGALYIKRGTRFRPFFVGGHQEHGRRAGTENVPGIVALGKACELAAAYLQDEVTRVRALRDRLEREILARVPDSFLNGGGADRTPNTTSISFEYIEGEAILLYMSDAGICASSGSACTSGSLEPSHVLRAMGVPIELAHSAVRFSLSRYNTDADVDYIIDKLPPIIARLREMSPFAPK